jgi:uncharacterized protein (TIGR02058 family)
MWMAEKRVIVELGMGTDIRGGDSTKASVRALRDALWRNSLGIAGALGLGYDAMRVKILIGVPNPASVDKDQVLAVLPHGSGTVEVVEGGLEVPNAATGDRTIIAHAAAIVSLDMPEGR